MKIVIGSLLAVLGVFLVVCAFLQTDFVVYQVLSRKAKRYWKDNYHNYNKVIGTALAIVGILMATGIIE